MTISRPSKIAAPSPASAGDVSAVSVMKARKRHHIRFDPDLLKTGRAFVRLRPSLYEAHDTALSGELFDPAQSGATPDPTPKAGLARAFDLAATMTGKVTAFIHEVDLPPINNVLAELLMDVSKLAAAAEDRSRECEQDLTAELHHLANRLRLPLDIREIKSRPELAGDLAARTARSFDFTLLALRDQSTEQVGVAESVLFDSGGPVIVFPELDAPAHLATVAIAWDGSRAAARAVRDAMPVLALAKHTLVISVGDDKPIDLASLSDLRRFLWGTLSGEPACRCHPRCPFHRREPAAGGPGARRRPAHYGGLRAQSHPRVRARRGDKIGPGTPQPADLDVVLRALRCIEMQRKGLGKCCTKMGPCPGRPRKCTS